MTIAPPHGTVLDTFEVNGVLHELVQGDSQTKFTRVAAEQPMKDLSHAEYFAALRANAPRIVMKPPMSDRKQFNRDQMQENERRTNLDRFFNRRPDYIALSRTYGGHMFIHNRRCYDHPSGRIGYVTHRLATWREGGRWFKYAGSSSSYLDRAIAAWGKQDTTDADMILRAIA